MGLSLAWRNLAGRSSKPRYVVSGEISKYAAAAWVHGLSEVIREWSLEKLPLLDRRQVRSLGLCVTLGWTKVRRSQADPARLLGP